MSGNDTGGTDATEETKRKGRQEGRQAGRKDGRAEGRKQLNEETKSRRKQGRDGKDENKFTKGLSNCLMRISAVFLPARCTQLACAKVMCRVP